MWYYSINDRQHGPVGAAALKSFLAQHVITPATLVWREGMAAWLPMDQTGLAAELRLPLPEGDTWETCACSGDKVRRSEMVPLDGFWVATAHKDAAVEYLHQGGRLPKVEIASAHTGSLELGHLMRSSWEMLAACLKPACGLYLLVWVPVNLLCSYTEWQALGPEAGGAIVFINVLHLLLGPIANGGILFLFSRHLRGMRPGFREALSGGFFNWGQLIVVQMMTLLLTMVGLVFLIIPGLLLVTRLSLSRTALVDGQLSASTAVKTSWNVTEGHFWRTFGYLLLVGLMCDWPVVVLNTLAHHMAMLKQWITMGVLTTVLSLPLIYFKAFTFCYYKELQARHLMQVRRHI